MSSDKEILALEDKRYAAMCGGDFAALEAIFHDELLYTHSSGLTDTKATWLASLRSGKTKYKRTSASLAQVLPVLDVDGVQAVGRDRPYAICKSGFSQHGASFAISGAQL
jgi:hypothetical protein